MGIDWLSVLIGWVGGILSGLIANWGFQKFVDGRRKKSKKEYFTSTWEENAVTFEGRLSGDAANIVDMGRVTKKFLGSVQTSDDKSRDA